MIKRFFLIFIHLFISFNCLLSQTTQVFDNSCFYGHYSGNIDSLNLISLDLSIYNGKISGSYYCYFPVPNNNKTFSYGTTIPLQGFIDGEKFTLTDFTQSSSRFNCILEKNNKIIGTYQRNPYEKTVPFTLTEDYSNGSLPFTCYSLKGVQYLEKGKNSEKNSPKAEINILLLFPNLNEGNPLKNKLDITISNLFSDTNSFKSPELLLDNIKFDFFSAYYSAFEGVRVIKNMPSFNWELNISMAIIYNERNIVSLKIDKYAYTGGAHGINITQYIVYDLYHNRPLEFKDIMQKNYEAKLNILLNQKLRKLNGIKSEENLKDSGFFDEQIGTSENFYINKDGIGFYYNPYIIAPYSLGTTEMFIKFDELKEILNHNSAYFWNQSENEISNR